MTVHFNVFLHHIVAFKHVEAQVSEVDGVFLFQCHVA